MTCNSHHSSQGRKYSRKQTLDLLILLHYLPSTPRSWVKTILQLLAVSQVRNNPHCLSQSLTTGALSSPRLCRGSVWAGLGHLGVPLALTNQVPSGKSTSKTQRLQMDFWCSHQEYRDQNSCLLCLVSLFEIFTLIMVDVSSNDFSMCHLKDDEHSFWTHSSENTWNSQSLIWHLLPLYHKWRVSDA